MQQEKLKTILKWTAGIIFLLSGLGGIIKGIVEKNILILAGLCFLINAVICLPPTLRWIEEQLNIRLKTAVKYMIVIAFIVANVFIQERNEESTNGTAAKESSQTAQIKQPPSTPLTAEEQETKRRLKQEIDALEKPFDNSIYRGSIDNLELEIMFFGAEAMYIIDGEKSTNQEIRELAGELKKKVISIQEREYPKLRFEYAKVADQTLGNIDVTVDAVGTGNSVIALLYGALSSENADVYQSESLLHFQFTLFRFKEARFKFHRNERSPTYIKLDSKEDYQLVDPDSLQVKI